MGMWCGVTLTVQCIVENANYLQALSPPHLDPESKLQVLAQSSCHMVAQFPKETLMTSPPQTPPAQLGPPQTWRFEDTYDGSTELAEDYRPGGLHPVNIGDTFHGEKYKVIRKLGDGSYSTVWLASSRG